MINYQQLFHTGVRVRDLGQAMDDLGPALGVTWAVPRQVEQPLWTVEHGASAIALQFTYSVEGPQHVELVQGEPGTIWDAGDAPGVHHVGVWVDDLPAEAARLVSAGWHLMAAERELEAGLGRFAYLVPPAGLIVELVDSAVRPHFEAWWTASGSDTVDQELTVQVVL